MEGGGSRGGVEGVGLRVWGGWRGEGAEVEGGGEEE